MKEFFKLFSLTLVALILFLNKPNAQIVYFFTEGTSSTYYDQGIVDVANLGNSTFEHTFPPGYPQYNDKVPCVAAAYQGNTSLKFNYFSSSSGNWKVTIYKSNWSTMDISDKDSILFYVYSLTEIPNTALPKIGFRSVNTSGTGEVNSQLYMLSDYNDNVPALQWTKVKFPLSIIFNDPLNNILDFTKVEGIIFNQSELNNTSRLLYIDLIAAFKNTGPIPDIPYFTASGFDSHSELKWGFPGTDLSYRIYASFNDGQAYELRGETTDSVYLDFVPETARNKTINYRLVAFVLENESKPVETTAKLTDYDDEQLLDLVQRYTFRYFWEGAHGLSGLALESTSQDNNKVASGATGMGLMAMIVAYEREYRNREEIKDRILKILNFLENCDRFHGAWSHWYNGTTGKTIPFSAYDDGGDLAETAYVAASLIVLRNYFSGSDEKSALIRQKSTFLWQTIDWSWYRQGGQNVLTWHWSPNFGFKMGLKLKGWDETLATYILAAASPTNSITKIVYDEGWASGGNMVNKRSFYGYEISLMPDWGGSLFWIHYSFLGINPKLLKDKYGNYWQEFVNTAKIHHAYAVENPLGHKNYSLKCWGLTSSEGPNGYNEHQPWSKDDGTISPTAALSSMPYTPEESMNALKYFYRERGKDLFGLYGTYDAFNDNLNWIQKSYIGIDQGPIVVMIENYRTSLIWDAFMKDPEIQDGLTKLGFTFGNNTSVHHGENNKLRIFPNPANQKLEIEGELLKLESTIQIQIRSLEGRLVFSLPILNPGSTLSVNLPNLQDGVYLIYLKGKKSSYAGKLIVQN